MIKLFSRLLLVFGFVLALGMTQASAAQIDGSCWASYELPASLDRFETRGLKAFSSTDALLVGDRLAAHFDGRTLAPTTLPDLPGAVSAPSLKAVDGLDPGDAWAVGFYTVALDDRNTMSVPLTLHWNGSNWRNVPGPHFADMAELYAVRTVSYNDAWAVGIEFNAPPHGIPLIMHWDGSSWSVVPGLDALGDLGFRWETGGLRAVSGTTNDLWAIGYNVVLHWDGISWRLALRAGEFDSLNGVASSGGRAWVVGTTYQDGQTESLLLDWDGQTWDRIANPNQQDFSTLTAIYAYDAASFWAAGAYNTYNSAQPLLLNYDDHQLRVIDDPGMTPPVVYGTINAISVDPNGGIWLAGYRRLLLHYLPSCGQPHSRLAGRIFPETHQAVLGRFLDYWEQHGGLAQQGYPLSGEFKEMSDLNRQPYTVQYFERAVFERHPENSAPNDVLLSQLGKFQYDAKYPNGAPDQLPNHERGHYFPETGHWVGGEFWDYWESHGGLAQQGYPLSDEFGEVSDLNGQRYTVQYFERAVFEYHPENVPPYRVLLSQLGKFRAQEKYPQQFPLAAPYIVSR